MSWLQEQLELSEDNINANSYRNYRAIGRESIPASLLGHNAGSNRYDGGDYDPYERIHTPDLTVTVRAPRVHQHQQSPTAGRKVQATGLVSAHTVPPFTLVMGGAYCAYPRNLFPADGPWNNYGDWPGLDRS